MKSISINNRIDIIDALRGFALAGIAIAHIFSQFALGYNWDGWVETHVFDEILSWVNTHLVFSKFYSIFCILFGISFAIMMRNSLLKSQNFSWHFIWRLVILLIISIIHNIIFQGDILLVYALVGLLLPLFYRLENKWVTLVILLIFLGIGRYFQFIIFGGQRITTLNIPFYKIQEETKMVLTEGSLIDVFKLNWKYAFINN